MKHPSPEPSRLDPRFVDFLAGIVEAGADPAEERWPAWVRNDPALAAEARGALALMNLARGLPAAGPVLRALPERTPSPLRIPPPQPVRPWYAPGPAFLRRSLAIYLGAAAAIVAVLLLRGPEALGSPAKPDQQAAALAPAGR